MLSRSQAWHLLALAAATVLTLALTLPSLGERQFWFDELVSVEIAKLPVSTLVEYLAETEVNMGLYHLALALWLEVGSGEAALRALSVVFAVATLPFAYGLAIRLFDRRAAVFAVVLLAPNVSYVSYARDTRGYALTLLLVTASGFFLARAASTDHRRDWALYAAASALAVCAHLFAALVVVAHVLALVVVLRWSSASRLRALVAVGAIMVALVPLGLAVVLGGQGGQIDWLQEPRLVELPGVLEWLAGSRVVLAVYGFGVVAAFVLSAGRWPRTFLTAWLVLPPTVAFAASFVKPIFLDRYFLVCLPALVLLAAAGLARLRPPGVAWALVAVAVAFSIREVHECGACKVRDDDWRGAAEYVFHHARPGDEIFFYPGDLRTPFAHYVGESPKNLQLAYPGRWTLEGDADPDARRAVAELGGRVWLVTWWLPSQGVRERLSQRARLVEARQFAGDVRVELYEIS